MKRCPTCSRRYADESFQFCLDDGANLIRVDAERTEQFAVAPRAAGKEKSAAKFKWLIFSILGGVGILTILGASAGLFVVMFRGSGSGAPVSTNAPDNRRIPIVSPPTLFGTDDETEIKNLVERAAAAFVADDTATLDRFLADEYTEENSNGEKYTKKDVMKSEIVGERVSLRYTDLKVALENETATVTGIGESKFRILGTLIAQKYRFKSRLVNRDGRWQSVYSYSEYIY